ncbi:MAG: DUF2283 domain-containing protein [Planctomycetes bacterium]|nr:DUF2283 domain-containing protein [Planctomycetota bacterium]
MAVAGLAKKDILRVIKAVPTLVSLPASRMWIDYDEEADVLYLSLRRPQRATDSEMRDDGVIVHRRGKQIVGLTVLDASTR